MIEVVDSVGVFSNPRPELAARHAWHPSLVHLGADVWLCSFDLGQAPESHDYATHVTRSMDAGRTWSPPVRMLVPEPPPRHTHSVRIARLQDGTVLGFGARFVRSAPEQGLINHPGLGYCDVELITTRSVDAGRSWTRPAVVTPPVISPAFETCHAPVALRDGRVLQPTSTWVGWDGAGPEGMRALAFESFDGGETWPRALDEFDRWAEGIVSWEQSIAELADGRLVAVAWFLDTATGETLPSPYAIAKPGGAFGPARETGIIAQTMKIASLGGDRILAVYRRHDRPGLWSSTAAIGETWVTEQSCPVWQGAGSGMAGHRDVGTELSALEFGCPSIVVEDDSSAAVAFWCRERDVYGIRMLRLHVC